VPKIVGQKMRETAQSTAQKSAIFYQAESYLNVFKL